MFDKLNLKSRFKFNFNSYLNSLDQEKIKELLSKLNLKAISIILASSFILANVLSFTIDKIFYPKFNEVRKDNSSYLSITGGIYSLPPETLEIIFDRNLFNKDGTLGDDSREKKEVISDRIVRSKLKLEVVGIIHGGTPYNGIAIIKDKERGVSNNFSVGDRILNNVFLEEIHTSQVILRKDGNLEFLDLVDYTLPKKGRASSKGSSKNKSDDILPGGIPAYYEEEGLVRNGYETTITTAKKDHLLGVELPKVLQDAKASPNIVNGKVNGFILTRIKPNSIYEKSGLLNNDVVEEINGQKLSDAAGAIRLLQSLRNAKNIDITVVRGGTKIPLKLNVQ